MVDIQPEGMDVIPGMRTLAPVLLAAAALAPVGQAQGGGAVPEGRISVDVMPQFVTSYRQGAWMPVDVLVTNNKQDISGRLELSLSQAESRLSPAYVVPVESPKGSRKRFRAYCRVELADTLEVMLFHGRRRALPFPVRIALRPIPKRDVLAMILDEDISHYGFIYNALQVSGSDIGLHREGLDSDELERLPEYPQCYEPFNVIVMGRIDVEGIPQRQRELLTGYVERGGILIACIGENAARYRNTWVEQLAGARVGETLTVDERTVAQAVFGASDAEHAAEPRQMVMARLTPAAGDVYVRAAHVARPEGATERIVVATRRQVGQGAVVTLAVDAAGRGLQRYSGFLKLWNDAIGDRVAARDLQYASAASRASYTLPTATGIRVQPRTSVLTYLFLYFAVGIVGNWVFWNVLKRREMAWVCLVLFSFAFTGYALVYGTAGRAKSTLLSYFEVMRVQPGASMAKLNSIIGLVSARSSRYSFELTRPYSLVSDVQSTGYGDFGMYRSRSVWDRMREFQFAQGPTPEVDNFSVGASEMRVLRVESELPVSGGIRSSLVWGADGIRGEVINETGLALANPFLFVDGVRTQLIGHGGAWDVNIPNERLGGSRLTGATEFYGYYMGQVLEEHEAREELVRSLLTAGGSQAIYDESLGPYFCAWVQSDVRPCVDLGEPVEERVKARLLVADIHIARTAFSAPKTVYLPIAPPSPSGPNSWQFNRGEFVLGEEGGTILDIAIPPEYLESGAGTIRIELRSSASQRPPLRFRPWGTDPAWSAAHRVQSFEERIGYENYAVQVYEFEDWKALVDAASGVLKARIELEGSNRGSASPYTAFMLWGRLIAPEITGVGGEWRPWQS